MKAKLKVSAKQLTTLEQAAQFNDVTLDNDSKVEVNGIVSIEVNFKSTNHLFETGVTMGELNKTKSEPKI